MANAAAMKSTGLLDAGYSQFNIGEFGGLPELTERDQCQ